MRQEFHKLEKFNFMTSVALCMTACNTKGALAYIACEEHTNTYTAYKYRFRGTND